MPLTYCYFIITCLGWSLTFPLSKYLRLAGCSTWLLGLLQCSMVFCFSALFNSKPLRTCLNKSVLIISALRHLVGVSSINYLLYTQSLSQVTVALLLIPFFSLVYSLFQQSILLNKNKIINLSLSFVCIMSIVYCQLHENHSEFYSYLTLSCTFLIPASFALEAQYLKHITLDSLSVIHAQNGLGCLFLTVLFLGYTLSVAPINTITISWTMVMSVMFLMCLLSFTANIFFIKLNHLTDPHISTQINVCLVLLNAVYDALLNQHLLPTGYVFAIICGILACFSIHQGHTKHPA